MHLNLSIDTSAMASDRSGKRKFDGPYHISSSKRPRSSDGGSISSADSGDDFDIDVQSYISTPLTPQTPATPSQSKDPRPNKYDCPYDGCQKAFNRPARLEEHIRSHTNERPFECTYDSCNKTFLRQSHLSRHIKSAHTDERDYPCQRTGCGKTFSTGTRLRRHEQAHEDKDRFRCTEFAPCDKVFRKSETLQRHIELDHMQLKAFRCTQMDEETHEPCEEGFDTIARLRAHEARCHGERMFLCSFCSDRAVSDPASPDARLDSVPQFASYADLQAHIKVEHPPQCAHCLLVCSSARELKRHIDIHHSGITLEMRKTFICQEPGCGKGFTKQGNLNSHVRTAHHPDRSLICGKTDVSGSLGLHEWEHRNGCGRSFKNLITLETHIRVRHIETQPPQLGAKGLTSIENARLAIQATLAARLTGSDYSKEQARNVVCVALECSHQFTRYHDLMIHAKTVHDLDEEDILGALDERDALSGGKFWVVDHEDTYAQQDNTGENEWFEATGLNVPAVDVQGGYDMMFAPGKAEATSDRKDLQALVDFCAARTPISALPTSVCIDPALITPSAVQ